MPESFDAYDYLAYMSRRWLFVVVACGVALIVTTRSLETSVSIKLIGLPSLSLLMSIASLL